MNQFVIDRNIDILERFSCACSPPTSNPVQYFLRKEGNSRYQATSKQTSGSKKQQLSPMEKKSLKVFKRSPVNKEKEKGLIVRQTYKLAELKQDFYSTSKEKFFNERAKNKIAQLSPQNNKMRISLSPRIKKSVSPPMVQTQPPCLRQEQTNNQPKNNPFVSSNDAQRIHHASNMMHMSNIPYYHQVKIVEPNKKLSPPPNSDYFGSSQSKNLPAFNAKHQALPSLPINIKPQSQSQIQSQHPTQKQSQPQTPRPQAQSVLQPRLQHFQEQKLTPSEIDHRWTPTNQNIFDARVIKNIIAQKQFVVSQKDDESSDKESIILGHGWDASQENNPEGSSIEVAPQSVHTPPNSKLYTGQTEASTTRKSLNLLESIWGERKLSQFANKPRRLLN